jgi:hypothetical protein
VCGLVDGLLPAHGRERRPAVWVADEKGLHLV